MSLPGPTAGTKIPSKYLILLAGLVLARATTAGEVEAKDRAAKTACLASDYVKGVALLSELYLSTNDAVFSYNQGRCFEQNHRYEDAISRFREHLQVGKQIGKVGKANAQKHIADCQALLAKHDGSSSMPAKATADSADSRTAKERAAKKALSVKRYRPRRSEEHSGSRPHEIANLVRLGPHSLRHRLLADQCSADGSCR